MQIARPVPFVPRVKVKTAQQCRSASRPSGSSTFAGQAEDDQAVRGARNAGAQYPNFLGREITTADTHTHTQSLTHSLTHSLRKVFMIIGVLPPVFSMNAN